MSLTLSEFVEKAGDSFSLKITDGAEYASAIPVISEEINILGLEMSGYFDELIPSQIQVLSPTGMKYILSKHPDEREKNFLEIFSKGVAGLVLSDGLYPCDELIDIAHRSRMTLMATPHPARDFVRLAEKLLEKTLAPTTDFRGTMMEVFGVGILIGGKSNVGKSECAMDLIQRGHRLIGDDLVKITRRSDKVLLARGTPPIYHRMELRGVGIVDVVRLMGISAIKDVQKVELILGLEKWHPDKDYERLGLEEKFKEILGVRVPYIEIPVAPGRNTAILAEVCAMNYRLRKRGFVAAEELDREVSDTIAKTREE